VVLPLADDDAAIALVNELEHRQRLVRRCVKRTLPRTQEEADRRDRVSRSIVDDCLVPRMLQALREGA